MIVLILRSFKSLQEEKKYPFPYWLSSWHFTKAVTSIGNLDKNKIIAMTKLEVVSTDDSDSEVPRRSWRSFYKTNYTSKKSPRKFEDTTDKQETSPLFFQKWGKPIGFGGGILLLLLLIEISNLRSREEENLKEVIGTAVGPSRGSNPNEDYIEFKNNGHASGGICDPFFGKFEADDLICQCQCQMADRSEKAWRRRGLRDSYGHGSGPVLSDGNEIAVLQFAV